MNTFCVFPDCLHSIDLDLVNKWASLKFLLQLGEPDELECATSWWHRARHREEIHFIRFLRLLIVLIMDATLQHTGFHD